MVKIPFMFYFILTILTFVVNPVINAENTDEEIYKFIGMDIKTAWETLGHPEEIFPMRGEKEWHDDVIFYYGNHFYLFWYKNHGFNCTVIRNPFV